MRFVDLAIAMHTLWARQVSPQPVKIRMAYVEVVKPTSLPTRLILVRVDQPLRCRAQRSDTRDTTMALPSGIFAHTQSRPIKSPGLFLGCLAVFSLTRS